MRQVAVYEFKKFIKMLAPKAYLGKNFFIFKSIYIYEGNMTEKKLKAIKEKQTQTQIIAELSESTGLSKKDVKAVLESLGELSHRHIMKRGSGEFKVPYVGVKVVRKVKPATKKRMGKNPQTGEEMVIAAKPKRDVVKATPLKSLKVLLEKK